MTWPEVSGLHFNPGQEHSRGGLYARQGAWVPHASCRTSTKNKQVR